MARPVPLRYSHETKLAWRMLREQLDENVEKRGSLLPPPSEQTIEEQIAEYEGAEFE